MTMTRLASLFTDLGGHCMETLVEAFDARAGRRPDPVHRLDDQGLRPPLRRPQGQSRRPDEPDADRRAARKRWACAKGEEWEQLEGVGDNARPGVEALIERSRDRPRQAGPRVRIGRGPGNPRAGGRRAVDPGRVRPHPARPVARPAASSPTGSSPPRPTSPSRPTSAPGSTSAACSAAATCPMSSPRQRLHRRKNGRRTKKVSISSWASPRIQSFPDAGRRRASPATCSATRLFPIGTLYDPFIARGLDALNYACYQDARFLLVATPSGITLGPEGGAHQSINPPLIALGQPGLRHYEPAFADELAAMMEEAFRLIDDPDGESTYLRLSTRNIAPGRARRRQLARGRARRRLLAARARRRRRSGDRRDGRGHARGARGVGGADATTSPASACSPSPRPTCSTAAGPPPRRRAGAAQREPSHVEQLLSQLSRPAPASSPSPTPRRPRCPGSAASLGQRVAPLGVEKFGQTGNLADLYAAYRLDGAAITEAAAEILLQNG